MDRRDAATVPDADGEAVAPPKFGRFLMGKRLGAGGMGVVFEAHDTTLDRRVAMKLLHPGASRKDQLLHEAQALARLSHPNVVTVYEAGLAGDELYIAMELLEGATLKEWIGKPRRWREIVDMFIAAGRGLAAVHALDLVHRDFKPSNVLFDRAGTPKVGDFGVVCHAGERPEIVAGTPAYMPPEQERGDEIDARADQFAFATVLDGALGDDAPGRLRAVLARARAAERAQRFPSMAVLLDELAAIRRGRWRIYAAAGAGVGALGALALAWSLGASQRADPCPPPQRAAVLWSSRQNALREHLKTIDPVQGAARFDAVAHLVQPMVDAYSTMHVDACRATRVRGAQSDTLLDLRMACLDRHAAELDGAIDLVASAKDPESLDDALRGLRGVHGVDDCADADALGKEGSTPDDDALRRRIDEVEVARRAGRRDGLAERDAAIVADARALAHPHTLALALAAQGRLYADLENNDLAVAAMREVTQVAASAHDDRDEAEAWIRLISLIGFDQGQPDQGLALAPAASAAVLRAGNPTDLAADLLHQQAEVLDSGPRVAEGLADLDAEEKLLLAAGADQDDSPLSVSLTDVYFERGNAYDLGDRNDDAIAAYRLAAERYRKAYGPDSVDESMVLHDLAEAQRKAGLYDDALASQREAQRIAQERTGNSPRTADDLTSIGAVLSLQNKWSDALAAFDQALADYRTTLGADDVQLVPAMVGRAQVLGRSDRPRDALAAYSDAIALIQKSDLTTRNLPIALYDRGELEESLGDTAQALADYRLSVSEFETMTGKDSAYLVYPLVGEARVLIATKQAAVAIPLLERALALPARGGDTLQAALARAWLGRAQFAVGHRADGLAIAKEGRAEIVAASDDPDTSGELAQLDKWLAHPTQE